MLCYIVERSVEVNIRDVSAMVEVDWAIVERPYADWLSAFFGSSPSAAAAASSNPRDTEGWLLERENRENRMPPMPLPILAAPTHEREGERERGREGERWRVGAGERETKRQIKTQQIYSVPEFIAAAFDFLKL